MVFIASMLVPVDSEWTILAINCYSAASATHNLLLEGNMDIALEEPEY